MTPTIETMPLVSPWELLRSIASWFPDSDRDRALRIIEAHEAEHRRREKIEGAD